MLYFLHIPKTAGTSLKSLLADHFDYAAVCPVGTHEDIFPYSPLDLRRFELFMGHFTYALVPYIGKPCEVITFVRRPRDQVRSMFNDLLCNGVLPAQMTLSELLRSIHLQRFINVQTRWLASDDLGTSNLGYNLTYSNLEQALRELQDRRLLERAKQRLDSMRFVGITERFRESYALLCEEFGWPQQQREPLLNVRANPDRTAADEESMRELMRLQSLDEELYAYATTLLDRHQAQSARHEPGAKYRWRMSQMSKHDEWKVDFAQPLCGEGWHEREQVADGTFARWSGPREKSTLHLPLRCGGPLQLSFFIRAALEPENIDYLELYVNHREVPIRKFFSAEGEYSNLLCLADIPAHLLPPPQQCLELEWRVPRTIRPCDVDPANMDDRRLGIMVNWVCAIPHPAPEMLNR